MRPRLPTSGPLALTLALSSVLGLGACEKARPPADAPESDADGDADDPPTDPSAPIFEDPGAPVTRPIPAAEDSGQGQDQDPSGGEAMAKTTLVPGSAPCTSDADCVRATCCHPTTCVNPKDAQDCSATNCTMECKAGSLDCFGACLCHEGTCAAQLWTPDDGA